MIITAIYSTSHVLNDAEKILAEELSLLGQIFVPVLLSEEKPNLVDVVKDADISKSLFSVRGFENSGGEDHADAFRFLNFNREYFVEENVRVLLWLKPKEFQQMALVAPDFWSFRHSVIDFTENRATPKRFSSFQGISLLKFPWEVSADNLEGALEYRENMLSEMPPVDETLLMRLGLYGEIANLYFQQGELSKSAEKLNDALEMIPDGYFKKLQSKILWGIAAILIEQGRVLQAEAIGIKAIENLDAEPHCLTVLARARRLNGRNTKALKDALRAVRLMPEDAPTWNEVGNIYLNLGRFNDGLDAYQKAFDFFADPKILLNQAALLISAGRLDDARSCVQHIPCDTLRYMLKASGNSTSEFLEKLCR